MLACYCSFLCRPVLLLRDMLLETLLCQDPNAIDVGPALGHVLLSLPGWGLKKKTKR